MKKALLAAFASSTMLFTAPAFAAVTLDLNPATVADASETIFFNGIVNGSVASGLTARLDLTLTSLVGNTATFNYTLANTTTGGDSRVSLFGFSTTPDIASASILSGSPYDAIRYDDGTFNGNLNQVAFSAEACLAGSGGNNCNGGGGDGVLDGASTVGSFRLVLESATTSITFENFFARYQSLAGFGGGSGIGIQVPGTPVPGPLAGAGLPVLLAAGGLAWARRRRVPAAA